MSKRAEEKSIAYQLATHGPRVMGGSAILSEDDYKFWNINYDFKAGYEQAEKDLGWISVKDRLPEVGDIVLVHDKICCTMRLAQLFKSGNWAYRREDGYGNRAVTVAVDYWMEIPKLPEEEKK